MNRIEKLAETLILVFIVNKDAQREKLERDVMRTQNEPRSSEVESSRLVQEEMETRTAASRLHLLEDGIFYTAFKFDILCIHDREQLLTIIPPECVSDGV